MSEYKPNIQDLKFKVKIGCQGWNYEDWVTAAGGKAVFYPRATRGQEMLEIYARAFDTVEVDSTFYGIPKDTTLKSWRTKTPDNFSFSLKLPQDITHTLGLEKKSFDVLHEFCERVLILEEKLGAILIQLPPQFVASEENTRTLQAFLRELPAGIRFAVEFRDRNWFDAHTFELLGKYGAALCLTEGNWVPRATVFHAAGEEISDFAYVRFMGERDLTSFDHVQRQQNANLELWHQILHAIMSKTVETFVYFSNFYEGFAPASCNKLKEMVGQETIDFSQLENQQSLF